MNALVAIGMLIGGLALVVSAGALLLISIALTTRAVPRWSGGLLVAVHAGFVGNGTIR
jgi:hypothetical protein